MFKYSGAEELMGSLEKANTRKTGGGQMSVFSFGRDPKGIEP